MARRDRFARVCRWSKDVETGVSTLVGYLCVADVGTVIHPAALGGQILGRSILGIGHTLARSGFYDQKYGVALAKRFYRTNAYILDLPVNMQWAAVVSRILRLQLARKASASLLWPQGAPRPQRDFGRARRRGVPPRACERRQLLTSLEAGKPMMQPLTANV